MKASPGNLNQEREAKWHMTHQREEENIRRIKDDLDFCILKLKLSRIDNFLISYLKTLGTITPSPLVLMWFCELVLSYVSYNPSCFNQSLFSFARFFIHMCVATKKKKKVGGGQPPEVLSPQSPPWSSEILASAEHGPFAEMFVSALWGLSPKLLWFNHPNLFSFTGSEVVAASWSC